MGGNSIFNERKPIPFLCKGPDPSRCYARDHNRWSVVEASGKDDFVVKVFTKKGWGRAETLSVSLIPIVGFLLFGFISARLFLSKQEFAVDYFFAISFICLGMVVLFAILVFSEVTYFNRIPSVPLTIFENGEFSVGDDKSRNSLPPGSLLRYTLHYPDLNTQGGSTFSELDLVVRDDDRVVAVHKIMAHQNNGCWRHARRISQLSSIPLQRIALQANGKPFPPPLPN